MWLFYSPEFIFKRCHYWIIPFFKCKWLLNLTDEILVHIRWTMDFTPCFYLFTYISVERYIIQTCWNGNNTIGSNWNNYIWNSSIIGKIFILNSYWFCFYDWTADYRWTAFAVKGIQFIPLLFLTINCWTTNCWK